MMPVPNRGRLSVALFAVVVVVAWGHAAGQQRASPHETTSETIDGAEMTITYGRPYMRGRTIMGGLVPYGKVWCPGADEATTLATTAPLKMGGLTLPFGRYTLWMLPSAGDWQLIVSKQTGQWHTQYDASQDLGRVTLEKRTLSKPVNQLTFGIVERRGQPAGRIVMRWETTEVFAPFTVVQ